MARAKALPLHESEHFLTTEEVLEYLHVNVRTVYRLIKAGQFPAVRVGRQWRFRKQDIDSWLEGRRLQPDNSPGDTRLAPVGSHKRVLVVDDEDIVRTSLLAVLASAHYEVDTARDASSTLDKLQNAEYDLLVTDLNLPDMDGLSLIRQVRSLNAQLPVIIITGYSSESSAIEAVNLGVTAYLTKPLLGPQLLEAAARALGC